MARMRAYRLGRVREQLARYDFGACVLFDPINIRYATGTRNMALWTQHSPDRYVFVPAEGPVILFDREVVWHQVENFKHGGAGAGHAAFEEIVEGFHAVFGGGAGCSECRAQNRADQWGQQVYVLLAEMAIALGGAVVA